VVNVILKNKLNSGVSAKDIILYLLKEKTVKGGVGKVFEYTGEGVKSLSVTDRATIANMGAELGATTSIFPSDEQTLDFLTRQGRSEDFVPVTADQDAEYDEVFEIDLNLIEPLCAMPHSPDNVDLVKNHPIKVNQVIIGSCTNSSYMDMMKVAQILKGKKVHPDVSMVIAPGSSNILQTLIKEGALGVFVSAGARIIESACGPCIGMGQAPQSGGISLRTMNRNFKGRSGTIDANVYLVSPETAAVSAITGYLTDPRGYQSDEEIIIPDFYEVNRSYLVYPSDSDKHKEVYLGPNIKPFPLGEKLKDVIQKKCILKVSDNITTDDITPSDANLLPYRSNIPYLSTFCFRTITDDFKKRADQYEGGIIIAGENYGQGSSREHAALVPLFLKVKAVIAKSFARIHKANLINSGILPLEFVNPLDYDSVDEFDDLTIQNITHSLQQKTDIIIKNESKNRTFSVRFNGSDKDIETLILGGTILKLKEEVSE